VFEPPGVVEPIAPTVGLAEADGVQCAVIAPPGAVEPFCVAVTAAPVGLFEPVGCPLPAAAPPPPLPPGWPAVGPPVSTVELTWTIACRKGGTASAMLAMNAMPASTPIGRNQAMPVGQAGLAGEAACRGDGEWVMADGSSRSRLRSPGRGSDSGQTQWPCQTQCLAWPNAPAATLTSHGCGWRPLVLARIRSSPSAPGSTWSAATCSARRSALSRPSSGEVMPSPACPPAS